MSNFSVLYGGRNGEEPFSTYVYHVERDGERVADISHDYRTDEHWIRRPGGTWQRLPSRIVVGCEPSAFALTLAGIAAVEEIAES